MKIINRFFKILLWTIIAYGTVAHAADPSQYGTPFSGVPDPQDASIYQVNMRCFSSTRNFQGVIQRLDKIKALGVNVLYLMPFYPVGTLKSVNSPYCEKDYVTIGSEFGTLSDLRQLVDSAHSLGMAVIFDWVANHTAWDHTWITPHKSWYLQDGTGKILSPPGQSWNDVAQLNFSNDTMVNAMIDAMRFWVFTANCDGFRCDYAAGPPDAFWTKAISNLRSITTHKLIIFAEGDHSANYTSGFDYNFSWNFYNTVKQINSGSTATLIDNSNAYDYNGATGSQQIVRWLSNHDIYGSEGSPYTVFGGKTAVLANFVVSAYMKSVPFIYNGMEVGDIVPHPFPFTGAVIDWTQDSTVTPEMTKIILFRDSSLAIRRGTMKSYTSTNVCAFKKVSGKDSVFVFVNLRNAVKTFTLPSAIAYATVKDAFTGTSDTLGTIISLTPYEYRVFTIESTTGINSYTMSDEDIKIYPNPTENSVINIKISDSYKNSKIDIFDSLGRIVYQNILSDQLSTIDISAWTKGIFIVKISSVTNKVLTQKLLVD